MSNPTVSEATMTDRTQTEGGWSEPTPRDLPSEEVTEQPGCLFAAVPSWKFSLALIALVGSFLMACDGEAIGASVAHMIDGTGAEFLTVRGR